MRSFDRIHVLDLHGNAKKKEISPDGSSDKNVFDIMQGVAIIVAVRHRRDSKKAKSLAEVRHGELWGSRAAKGEALWRDGLGDLISDVLEMHKKYFMFYPINNTLLDVYENGFSLSELMSANQIGFQSHRDDFAVAFDLETISFRLGELIDFEKKDAQLQAIFDLEDNRDWNLSGARKRLIENSDQIGHKISVCDYRPFDRRYCLLDEVMMDYPRWELLRNCQSGQNFALNFVRQTKADSWGHALASLYPAPAVYVEIKDGSNFAPLYLYPDESSLDKSVRVNFEPKLFARIRETAGLTGPLVAPSGTDAFRTATGEARPDEVKLFDYIYGVLHCPAYRKTFSEFLKIDFPRIPFPASPENFTAVSREGEALRRLHLMEDAAIGIAAYPFEGDGDSVVDNTRFDAGRVWINGSQYFFGVPDLAWNFYIGGYQPAQKWLKDRKGRTLSWDDIRHYQKIIKILSETNRIMNEITMPL